MLNNLRTLSICQQLAKKPFVDRSYVNNSPKKVLYVVAIFFSSLFTLPLSTFPFPFHPETSKSQSGIFTPNTRNAKKSPQKKKKKKKKPLKIAIDCNVKACSMLQI